jgi:hypothetical protein
MRQYKHKSYGRNLILMAEEKLSDFASHPISISFRMISTKYSSNQWEVEIQMSAQVFGPKNNNSLCVGRAFVVDTYGTMSPLLAFKTAVDQIVKGDKNWRPILCHDQER